MAVVVDLASFRMQRRDSVRPAGLTPPASFFFDLGCPYSYLAIDRVERLLPGARWTPALGEAVHRGSPSGGRGRGRWLEAAAARASELRVPLTVPPASKATSAMRVAAYASDQARRQAFAVAASRLAFCGGFDLEDPEVLAEAIAAAGLPLDDALRAARDQAWDTYLADAGRVVLATGGDRLPAVLIGGEAICGEENLSEAASRLRACRAG